MKAIVQDVYGSADVLELRDIDRAGAVIGGIDFIARGMGELAVNDFMAVF